MNVSTQMTSSDGDVCDRCRVLVDDFGQAIVFYHWAGNDREGCDKHDEDVSTWSDQQIRDLAANIIGIENGRDQIEVVWI